MLLLLVWWCNSSTTNHCHNSPNSQFINNMAMAVARLVMMLMLMLTLTLMRSVRAADPTSLQDFCVGDVRGSSPSPGPLGFPCRSPGTVTGGNFRSTVLTRAGNTAGNSLGTAITVAADAQFPALNGQGLAMARFDYARGGVIAPHVHPRASEILLVLNGTLSAGFVDSQGRLFSQPRLGSGELFVFPRGLAHYSYNVGDGAATSVSAFDSQSPGTSFLSMALFASRPPIPDPVLTASFKISAATLHGIQSALSRP